MTQNEKEIMEMAEAYLVSGNFSRTAKVRVKFSAYGYSVKIGTKAFLNHVPHICDCISDVERLGLLGYNVEQANVDIEALS
jgi:hypothetical protein